MHRQHDLPARLNWLTIQVGSNQLIHERIFCCNSKPPLVQFPGASTDSLKGECNGGSEGQGRKDRAMRRLAELEDKVAKIHITEEEIKAYQKVASLLGGGQVGAEAQAGPLRHGARPPLGDSSASFRADRRGITPVSCRDEASSATSAAADRATERRRRVWWRRVWRTRCVGCARAYVVLGGRKGAWTSHSPSFRSPTSRDRPSASASELRADATRLCLAHLLLQYRARGDDWR